MRRANLAPKKKPYQPTWQEVLDEFILNARVKNMAETTIKDYMYYLPRFFSSSCLWKVNRGGNRLARSQVPVENGTLAVPLMKNPGMSYRYLFMTRMRYAL